MTLIYTCHCEVSERVLRVVIETHHLTLVVNGGIESREAYVISPVTVLIVGVGRECLAILKVRYERVTCTRREERSAELRGILEITYISVDSVSTHQDVLCTCLNGACQEFGLFALSVRSLVVTILRKVHAFYDIVRAIGLNAREKTVTHKTISPE